MLWPNDNNESTSCILRRILSIGGKLLRTIQPSFLVLFPHKKREQSSLLGVRLKTACLWHGCRRKALLLWTSTGRCSVLTYLQLRNALNKLILNKSLSHSCALHVVPILVREAVRLPVPAGRLESELAGVTPILFNCSPLLGTSNMHRVNKDEFCSVLCRPVNTQGNHMRCTENPPCIGGRHGEHHTMTMLWDLPDM